MSVAVTMKGMLDPIILNEDFGTTIYSINIAAASGKTLLISEKNVGSPVALHLENILAIEDLDEEEQEEAFE